VEIINTCNLKVEIKSSQFFFKGFYFFIIPVILRIGINSCPVYTCRWFISISKPPAGINKAGFYNRSPSGPKCLPGNGDFLFNPLTTL
jgi:hypothetical protein